MCSVTFLPSKRGYLLGMNRDEQRTRPVAFVPRIHDLRAVSALYPYEAGGGTWIGVNNHAVTLALINWYSIEKRSHPVPMSRGQIIPRLMGCKRAWQLKQAISEHPLENVYPFRLVAAFPNEKTLVEWRWNQVRLDSVEHDWILTGWFSSGLDEPGAQINREKCLREAAQQPGKVGPVTWLRQLHSSHSPRAGPYSVCMHRKDAATVSYTEVACSSHSVRMSYSPDALCRRTAVERHMRMPRQN